MAFTPRNGSRLTLWQYAIRESRLSKKARGVAFALALRMDNGSLECWPAVETIARESGWSESSTRVALDELAANGYLNITYRGVPPFQDTNLYRGTFPRWYKASIEPRNEPGF